MLCARIAFTWQRDHLAACVGRCAFAREPLLVADTGRPRGVARLSSMPCPATPPVPAREVGQGEDHHKYSVPDPPRRISSVGDNHGHEEEPERNHPADDVTDRRPPGHCPRSQRAVRRVFLPGVHVTIVAPGEATAPVAFSTRATSRATPRVCALPDDSAPERRPSRKNSRRSPNHRRPQRRRQSGVGTTPAAEKAEETTSGSPCSRHPSQAPAQLQTAMPNIPPPARSKHSCTRDGRHEWFATQRIFRPDLLPPRHEHLSVPTRDVLRAGCGHLFASEISP